MADMTSTRRGAFGAIAVASLMAPLAAQASTAPVIQAAASSDWARQFQKWTAANEAFLAADDEAEDRLGTIECKLWSRLMQMPAPDRPAPLWKLNYLYGEPESGDYCASWQNDIVAAVIRDANRLLAA